MKSKHIYYSYLQCMYLDNPLEHIEISSLIIIDLTLALLVTAKIQSLLLSRYIVVPR